MLAPQLESYLATQIAIGHCCDQATFLKAFQISIQAWKIVRCARGSALLLHRKAMQAYKGGTMLLQLTRN